MNHERNDNYYFQLPEIPSYLVHPNQCVESCRYKSYKYASAHIDGANSGCKCFKTLPSTLVNIDLQNCAALKYWVSFL